MEGRQYFEDFCRSQLANVIVLPKTDFVKEHKKLLGVLKRQNPKELSGERQEQAAELRKITKGEPSRSRG